MQDVVFVKLGGSLITDKERQAHAHRPVIDRLATEISRALSKNLGRASAECREALLLGHGSGSFGHVAAVEHGFVGVEKPSALAAAQVARAASRLHGLILDACLEAQVPAFSWSPSSVVEATDTALRRGGLGVLPRALEAELVPVVYGDVVLDSTRRASIASTEAVVDYLTPRLKRRGFRLKRLIWLGETDGIWDHGGHPIRRIDAENYRRVRRAVGGSRGTDVTGGMLLRLDTAWRLALRGVGSIIADGRREGLLEAALCGEDVPGTRVIPS